MSRHIRQGMIASCLLIVTISLVAGCSLLTPRMEATATPTRTPRRSTVIAATRVPSSTPIPLPTDTPAPTAKPTDTPSPIPTAVPPTPTREPTAVPPTAAPAATPVPPTPPPAKPTAPPQPTVPPAAKLDFVITELRVLGQGENNGGIEGPGAGRTIFITVIDAAGNPVDAASIVNKAPYPGRAVSGDKGPGKAEILMDREVFQLAIESVAGQPVSSEVSHNLSLIEPAAQDIAGKLGSTCPTVDNCPLPPYKHFSYVITFRRTH